MYKIKEKTDWDEDKGKFTSWDFQSPVMLNEEFAARLDASKELTGGGGGGGGGCCVLL